MDFPRQLSFFGGWTGSARIHFFFPAVPAEHPDEKEPVLTRKDKYPRSEERV
jgi:hypothetical protein